MSEREPNLSNKMELKESPDEVIECEVQAKMSSLALGAMGHGESRRLDRLDKESEDEEFVRIAMEHRLQSGEHKEYKQVKDSIRRNIEKKKRAEDE